MALNFNLNSLFEPALLADEPWWSYILGGAGWTVALMLSSFALALALGIIVGTLRTSQNKFLSTICEVWIELFRNIPLIVQIFVWFFVVPEFIPWYKDWMNSVDPVYSQFLTAFICMGFFVIGMIYTLVCKKNAELVKNALTEIDFQTLLLLAGLFIVIGSLTYNGIIDDISQLLVNLGGSNLFLMYTLIVWASVLFSAFIDNIPYVATMLPVVAGIASRMGCAPHLLYFGLLVGATLGGNLTPIGASANIAAIGILRKAGYEVKTKEFLRIGVPFTLLAVLVGYLFCWFIWS